MKQNNQQVTIPRLESFDKHFICGSVKSDVNPIRLTLIVEKDDGMYSVEYTDASQFVDGPIMFQISNELTDGKYIAKILYARDTLASLKFEVANE